MFRQLFQEIPKHKQTKFWSKERIYGSIAYLTIPSVGLICWLQGIKNDMELENNLIKHVQVAEKHEKEQVEIDKWKDIEKSMTELHQRLSELEAALKVPPSSDEGFHLDKLKAVIKRVEESKSTADDLIERSGINQRARVRQEQLVEKN